LRKVLIGVSALVVVLVGVLLVAPAFIDPNDYKPEIQASVKDATGRDLTIGGDISLSLLPSPSLSVAQVSLSNMAGGGAEPMVTLDALRVNLALMPLLSGSVKVTSVTLDKPTIVLETTADGKANWIFDNAPSEGAASSTDTDTSSESSGLDLAVDKANIRDGTLIYRDGATGTEQRITGLNISVSAGGLMGPFEADGTLSYQDLPLGLTATVGEIATQGSTPIKLDVSVADGAGTATVSGLLNLADESGFKGPSFKGDVSADAPDTAVLIGRVTAALGDDVSGLPAALTQAGAISAKLDGGVGGVTAEDLSVSLGDTRLQGRLSVSMTDGLIVDAALSGNRLDLDALMPIEATGATAPAPGGQATSETASTGGFVIPGDLGGTVELSVDAVQFQGSAIRNARVNLTAAGGVVAIDLATAQLPGGSEVTVTGTLETPDGAPKFAGQVEMVSDNLRGTLDWLGVDLAGISQDRLRKASFSAAVAATSQQVDVSNARLELDATQAQGAVTVALRDRPAFGLSLNVDRINVDAYLPSSGGAAASTGDTGAPVAGGTSDGAGPLAVLGAFDANLNVTVGEATAAGIPIRDAKFDVLLQQGTLTLRDVSVADAGGARGQVSGTLKDATGDATVDLKFDVGVVSVERLARTLSTDVPIAPAKLGKVSLQGSASGTMRDVALNVKLALAGGTLGLKGTAQPLGAQPVVNLAYTLDHPDANALFDVVAPGSTSGLGRLGGLTATGEVSTRDDGRYKTSAGISLAGAAINVIGNIDAFAAVPDLNLAIEVNHPDTVTLIRRVAPDYKPSGGNQGAFKFRSEFTGPTNKIALGNIELIAGKIQGSGNGSVDLTGGKPRIALQLGFGDVLVDPWLPEGTAKPQGAVPAVPVGGKSGGADWSRDKIDLSGLSAVDAKVGADFRKILYGSYIVDNAQLVATLENGVLDVSRLGGGMFGGTFDMTAQVADRPTPTAALNIKVRDADVRQAASTAAETDIVSGILTYDTDLKTAGGSEFEMVSNLAGTGAFNVREGAVEGFNLRAFSDQLKQLDRVPDFLSLIERSLNGGSTKFTALKGSYTVQNGILRSNDITLTADAANGTATAVVDLPPRQMDVQAQARLTEHPNSPPLGVQIVGPLDNPRQIFKTDEMQAYVLQRLAQRGLLKNLDKVKTGDENVDNLLKGILGGGQQPAPAPAGQAPSEAPAPQETQQPTQIKPEDAVKGLLKGILGN
jgi:uncharacterized protein involved in outer membrane biogenesis